MIKKSLIFFICIFLISPIVFAEDDVSEEEIRESLADVYLADKDYDKTTSQYKEILKMILKILKLELN